MRWLKDRCWDVGYAVYYRDGGLVPGWLQELVGETLMGWGA